MKKSPEGCRAGIQSEEPYTSRRQTLPVPDKTKKPRNKYEAFMARPKGFEPSTYRFVAGHSIR